MDWVRGVYYHSMLFTGLADKYRNQQFIPMPMVLLNREREEMNLNIGGPNMNEQTNKLLKRAVRDAELLMKLLDN